YSPRGEFRIAEPSRRVSFSHVREEKNMRVASICLLLAFAQESADPYYKFAKDTAWTYSMTGPDGKAAKMTIKVTGEKDGKVMVEMAQAEKGNESKLAWYVDGGIFYWSEKKGDAYKEAIGMW